MGLKGAGRAVEKLAIQAEGFDLRRAEILGGIWGRMTERAQQSTRHQNRDIMFLDSQKPAHLLNGEAGGKSFQGEE